MLLNWQTLSNPFQHGDNNASIIGHVSGRSRDVLSLLTGRQSAIILVGAPQIGKTTLVRYLSNTADWTWRSELAALDYGDLLAQKDICFVSVNLQPLKVLTASEAISNPDVLLAPFVHECLRALSGPDFVETVGASTNDLSDLYELRRLLNKLSQDYPNRRYFIMLDTLDSLALPTIDFSGRASTTAENEQERGLALLDKCGIIHILVDLIDTCSNFGVLLSLENLPRPKITDQFRRISADLARFAPVTLQALPWNESERMLAQSPSDFGKEWSQFFAEMQVEEVFVADEQRWLLEQGGTHPYLLHQLCFYTFYYKQLYATELPLTNINWQPITEEGKQQITELLNERVSTFLTRLWKRLKEALDSSSSDTNAAFYECVDLFAQQQPGTIIANTIWNKWGPELRYILYSEGIIRYDLLQPIRVPGAIIRDYLVQRTKESVTPQVRGFWLTIMYPGKLEERLSLSELEYRLIKTLLQTPKRSTEEELMKGAWGKMIERATFTQRMHHLRKKLREMCENKDVITNHYGGQYSLVHPEWLRLE